jgi:hypothetical protein
LNDWIDVDSQGRSSANDYSEALQKTDHYNIELCESQVVDLLNKLYLTCPTAGPSQPSDSDGRVLLRHACKTLIEEKTGRVLLRHACKTLIEEKTGRVHSINDARSNGKDIAEPEKDNNLKPVSIPIIDAMSPEFTDRDIATLVFHWTTVDNFNGFNRVR